MFERFTERAREVVVLAQQAARDAGQDRIDTAALLAGLVAEREGLAALVLRDFGVYDVGLGESDEPITEGATPAAGGGQLPLTHLARKALELALREALSLGHNYIATEHILLGLVRVDGTAAAYLPRPDVVRDAVVRELRGPGRPAARPEPSPRRLRTEFDGIVVTMDWIRLPDGRAYSAFRGMVKVLDAEAAVGFVPTGHNTANWIARVEGERTAVTLMGCQVRAVLDGDLEAVRTSDDLYVVP